MLVCVGDRLGSVDTSIPGSGTYASGGYIYSSIVGTETVKPSTDAPGKQVVEVVASSGAPVIPKPGDVVTVKITRVAQNNASADIVVVGDRALDVEFRGVIRIQDVRATEIDKVVMSHMFRPGDIVRCEVLSLGDARSYYLTTAKNELGVVYAKSLAGFPMVPASWTEMRCPETLTLEKRKVAKK